MNRLEWWLEDHIVLAFATAWLLLAATLFFSLRSLGRAIVGRRWWRASIVGVWAAGSVLLVAGLAKGTLKLWPELRRHAEVVDKPMPSLAYTTFPEGSLADLAALRGKIVLVNKWATYCLPCREEQPILDRLQREYGSRGLVVLQISQEGRGQIASFLSRFPMQTTVARTDTFPLPVPSLPATFVIDRAGVVRKMLRGSQRYDRLAAAVEDVL